MNAPKKRPETADERDIKKLNKTGKIQPWIDIKTNREGYVIARNVIVGQGRIFPVLFSFFMSLSSMPKRIN